MIAIVDKYFYKIHYTMWFCLIFLAFMTGAVNAGYRDYVAKRAEDRIMAEIPSDALSHLPINLLLKIPVTK